MAAVDPNFKVSNQSPAYQLGIESKDNFSHKNQAVTEKMQGVARTKWQELADSFVRGFKAFFRPFVKLLRGDYHIIDHLFHKNRPSQAASRVKDPQSDLVKPVIISSEAAQNQREELIKQLNSYQGWVKENGMRLAIDYKGRGMEMQISVKEEGLLIDIVKQLLKELNYKQFSVDGSRSTYIIEEEVVFKTDEETFSRSENINNIDLAVQNTKMKAERAQRKIKDKFNHDIAFQNATSLLVQTTFADLTRYVQYSMAPEMNSTGGIPNALLGNGSKHHIQLKGEDYYLTSTAIQKLINPLDPEDKPLGYVAMQRLVIIPKSELETDWTSIPQEQIAPKLRVIDKISKFCSTPEETEQDLKLKQL